MTALAHGANFSAMGTMVIVMVVSLVVITTSAYFFLLIFYPEWIGITGKSAHKTLEEHKEGTPVDDSDMMS
jgi:hypothetical protein